MKTCTKVRLVAAGVFAIAIALLAIESKTRKRDRRA
jgi:mannose/fructose/N-acetylgalactosamine-specific phosphotransferase system component IIC